MMVRKTRHSRTFHGMPCWYFIMCSHMCLRLLHGMQIHIPNLYVSLNELVFLVVHQGVQDHLEVHFLSKTTPLKMRFFPAYYIFHLIKCRSLAFMNKYARRNLKHSSTEEYRLGQCLPLAPSLLNLLGPQSPPPSEPSEDSSPATCRSATFLSDNITGKPVISNPERLWAPPG